MEQISPWPSPRKECYFCCDCTFTQTGLPLVKLGSPAYEGRCQGSAEPLLSPLWCCSDHLGEELQGVKLHNESVIDTATQPVTAQWSTGHFFFLFCRSVLKQVSTGRWQKKQHSVLLIREIGSFKAALLSLNLRAGSCPPLKTTVRGNHLLQPGLNSVRVRSAEKKDRGLAVFTRSGQKRASPTLVNAFTGFNQVRESEGGICWVSEVWDGSPLEKNTIRNAAQCRAKVADGLGLSQIPI